MKKIKIILLAAFCTQAVWAQDIHFSQFYASPMNLNPAEAGLFNGGFRFVGNERRQWASVTKPYQTFGFSADAHNVLRLKNIGAGLSLYNDVAGDSKFGTTQINLALSYIIKLNRDSSQIIAAGIQSGITQRKIDYTALTFDEQYNGYQWENTPVSETFANNGGLYPNVNAGAAWKYNISNRNNVTVGVSMFNITKPKQSFFGNTEIVLDRRLSFYAMGQIKASKKIDILPGYLYQRQGKYYEFDIGGSGKYILEDSQLRKTAVYLGLWTRTKDAGYITAGMDYNNWNVGISYDINYSGLTPASNGKGGLEISVIYILGSPMPKRLKYLKCPDYI